MKNDNDFSFAKYADDFDEHISRSIRGYNNLRGDCVAISHYFIQKDSKILDIGCSSGKIFRSIRNSNQNHVASVKYVGLDVEGEFKDQRYARLNEGGALILSEKVHAKNVKIQEMLTFTYQDFMRKAFNPQEILNKERSIRSQMRLWSDYKIFEMLLAEGFVANNMRLFWRNHLFVGILGWKQPNYRKG